MGKHQQCLCQWSPIVNNLYLTSVKFWLSILSIKLLIIFHLGLCITTLRGEEEEEEEEEKKKKNTTLRGDWRKFLTENPHVFIDEYCAIGPKAIGHFSKNHCEFKSSVEKIPSDCYCWISLDFWQGFESSSDLLPYIYLEGAKTTILTRVQRCTQSIFNEFKENYDPILINIGHQYQGLPCEEVSIVSNNGEEKTSAWKRIIMETIEKENANGWTNKQIGILIVRPILYPEEDTTVAFKKALKEEEKVTSYFDYEVLSQEWPVVIICLPSKEYRDLAIVQSRAIAKIIYISEEQNIGEESLPPTRMPVSSVSCFVLRKRIDVLTYHQELHTNEQLQEADTHATLLLFANTLIETLEKRNNNVYRLFVRDASAQIVSRAIFIFGYLSFKIGLTV
jgi:hypothetical protein